MAYAIIIFNKMFSSTRIDLNDQTNIKRSGAGTKYGKTLDRDLRGVGRHLSVIRLALR
jgi:hypothetical protein